jgi:arginine/lysine/ornithine decarboxylase
VDISLKKIANRVKTTLEQHQGPGSRAHRRCDARVLGARQLTFSIPAHNGGRGPGPEFTRWLGMDAARFDLPMSHGVDTRDLAWQVQSTAQELFAEAAGAKQTLFSSNGSSMNVRVAMMAVAGPGETIVMARNGHKSAFAGLVLSGARPVWTGSTSSVCTCASSSRSPRGASTLRLSSIDGARRQFMRDGRELLDRAVRSAWLLRERLATEVPELEVVGIERLGDRPGVTAVDPTHVLIETASVGLTGYQADDWLRDERHVDVELVDHRRIMPLVTFAHGEAEVDRLVRALRDLVDERGDPGAPTPVKALPRGPELRTDQAMLPRDAFYATVEMVRPRDAVGRISAELITPYPPGIPAVAPGEVYNDAVVSYLQETVANGAFVEGAVDTTLGQLRVVAESASTPNARG